jgi:1-acyl-sn-glycerol-3-phosphate acyltransferase
MPVFHRIFRLQAPGAEHLPREGAALVVCNHISLRDPPFVGAACVPRRARYMAKSELFRIPVLGALIRALGAFPVVRGGADREAYRTAREILAAGHLLVMFPEGTRHRDGRLRPGFRGAGALALAPGVTVVPAAIWGSRRPLGPVRVAFGPPLDFADIEAGPRGERSQRATDRIMAAIAGLIPVAGGPPTKPPLGEPTLREP